MRNGFQYISLWFSIIMIALVIAGAIAFTFTDFMSEKVYGSKRVIMIVVFSAYAIYRSIRIYQIFKTEKQDEE